MTAITTGGPGFRSVTHDVESHVTVQASILLLGNYRPTLAIARALAPHGHRVIVTRGDGEGCAEYSRHVAECWDHPPIDDEAAFVGALATFLARRPDVTTVLPVWEPCVLALARHHARLPADRIYATPPPDTVMTCLDKIRMLDLAREAGLPCAPFAVVDDYTALTREAVRIGFPVIVRPLSSSRPLVGKKALIAETPELLRVRLPAWPPEQDRLIVQRYVRGSRYSIYFAADAGRPIRFMVTETLRTVAVDGTGIGTDARTIELSAEVRGWAERLLGRLRYQGVGLFQLVGDEDRSTFLELNPRIGGNHALAEASGLELSRLAIDLARSSPSPEALVVAPAGRRCVWTYGDLRGVRTAVAAREISVRDALRAVARTMAGGVRADVHLTWDRRDPLPTMALYARLVPGVGTVVARRTARPVAMAPHPAGRA
jgi:predicted ATP-grasp superfamily ATP-dependent carboligase